MKRAFACFLVLGTIWANCEINTVYAKEAYVVVTKEDLEASKVFIQNLGNKAIEIIKRKGIDAQKVKAEFTSLMDNLDIASISRFCLRSHFKRLSSDQKKELYNCIRNKLSGFYSSKFVEYKTAKFIAYKAEQKNKSNKKQILVHSRIEIPGKKDMSLDWSVNEVDGGFKITDVVIDDGIRVSIMLQDEISGSIAKNGFNKFFEELKKTYGNMN